MVQSVRQLGVSEILVVEPSLSLQKVIEVCLRGADRRVVTCCDGETALDLATENPPSIIVTEVALAGVCGIEMVRRLRAISHCSDIPVIVLTGRVLPGLNTVAQAAGSDAFLMKPFIPSELRDTVDHLMRDQNSDAASSHDGS